MKGYYVTRSREGEMPEYFFGRNYKWVKEPTDDCLYKRHDRASNALAKCSKRYDDGKTKFAIIAVNEVE